MDNTFTPPHILGKLPNHLLRWQHCPLCKSGLHTKTEEGAEYLACNGCAFVHFSNPYPTVTAIIFHPTEDKVLLILRNREPRKGTWALPGGYMESGENPVYTAKRELMEEAGVEAEEGSWEVLGAWPGNPHYELQTTTVNLHYMGTCKELTDLHQPKCGSDADDVGWFAFDEMPTLYFTNQRLGFEQALIKRKQNQAR